MSGNGPDVIVNGAVNDYDRAIAFDAPVAFDTGLYVYPTKTLAQLRSDLATGLGMGEPSPGPIWQAASDRHRRQSAPTCHKEWIVVEIRQEAASN